MSESFIRVSGHARKRWGERSRTPRADPLTKWYEAVEIHPCELDAERARYHPGTRVVFDCKPAAHR